LIHPLADVQTNIIGKGTVVWQFSLILKGARIGEDCNINCHTMIEGRVKIGDRVTIKPGVYIWDGIVIESDVMIGPNVTFTNDKWPKSKNKEFNIQSVLIKEGASIGASAIILGGIVIGKFALIGAGALVTHDVPDRALVKGFPSKITGWMNTNGTPMVEENGRFIDNNGEYWNVEYEKLVKL
jgi:acetyltransferase-like isoleucine patch superfamily enzyme